MILVFSIFTGSLAPAAALCSEIWRSPVAVAKSVLKNKFVTDRDLISYKQELHSDFSKSIDALGPDGHWIDLGAGKALAQIDFLRKFRGSREAPLVTAVAYKLDRWFAPPRFAGKLQVKEGVFEEQSVQEWTRADIITDLFGVLSYTTDFTRAFSQALNLLKLNGELYITTTPWATRFNVHGSSMALIDFLSSIDGLRVEGRFGVIKITKEKEFIQVPSMILTRFEENLPPHRTFEERSD